MHQLRNRTPHILVLGDVMLDHYLIGGCHRISPEAPVPVVAVQKESVSLGGAGNVVKNLLALGARVSVLTAVGDDPSGRELRDLLQACGASPAGVVIEPHRQTPRKTRVVVAHHQVVRYDRETTAPIQAETERALCAAVCSQPAPPDAVLISDYAKGVVTPALCQTLIAYGRQHAIPVLVDPKGADGSKYRGATLLTPNRREAIELTGLPIDDEVTLQQAGAKLRRDLALDFAVITLSEEGLAVFDNGMTRIRSAAKEVYDVSGAGDTVLAALGFGLACGLSLCEAATVANTAAGIVVGKFGSATVTLDEIEAEQRLCSAGRDGAIQTADEIEHTARLLRSRGQRIVFTNGCFDLLHRGHVEYLRASRRCGDVLIVGLNSDRSVRRLKGPQRPFVAEEDRAAILAALQDVDYVVLFDEDTPYELIRRIRPDVLTKGADYHREEVVGHELVSDVRLIPLVQGRSTSRTIDRIQQAA
jgi:D-beta-D-heptose 7-phosphate kinase / D-beta-D-heptose 1-phosphate adenosyltransferase